MVCQSRDGLVFDVSAVFSGRKRSRKARIRQIFSLRRLIQICYRQDTGTIIGFHPEGKRNLNENPYEFLPAQPGTGPVICNARPQVIPVFIAGLGNDLPKQVRKLDGRRKSSHLVWGTN